MKLKMWVGNLDGSREGLVIAPTKVRARAIIGTTSRSDFDAYWHERPVDLNLDPEVLYTRRFGAAQAWFRGRCVLEAAQTHVRRFWLQPTPSFQEGAPQREEYLDDRAFDKACCAYAAEWRARYVCDGCSEVECPQCGAQGSTVHGR